MPDMSLLSWAGVLEYRQKQLAIKGAKAGVGEGALLAKAFTDFLSRLKEPVAIDLIASPHIPDGILDMLCATNPNILRFSPTNAPLLPTMGEFLDMAEQYALKVLTQHEILSLVSSSMQIFQVSDEWVSSEDISDNSNCRFDCHRRLLEN